MKKIILFIFLCVSFMFGYAQQWEWAYQLNSFDSFVRSIQTDSAGNPYFMGQCHISSVFNGQNGSFSTDSHEAFVAKYDSLGNVIWISGGIGAMAYRMSIDKHSNCYITGAFGGTASFGIGNDTLQKAANDWDYFLAKLDKDGKAVFANSGGGICQDEGISVTALPNDELFSFWVDATQCDHAGNWIYYFDKLDSNGDTIWSMNSNSGFNPNITLAKDGGFLLSNGTLITKHTENWVVEWTKTISGDDYYYATSIVVDSSGNMIFAINGVGSIYYDNILLPPKSVRTTYIVKTDSLGNLINYIHFTPALYPHFWLTDLKTDRQGNIYLLAITDTALYIGADSILFNLPSSQRAYVIIKLDSNMNYLWSQYAVQNTNWGTFSGGMAITDSYVYLGVNYNTPVFLNGSSFQFPAPTSSTSFNTFFAAIKNGNPVTSVSEIQDLDVTIFPCPSAGSFTVNLSHKTEDAQIRVYDVYGNCRLSKTCQNTSSHTLNLSSNAKGIYFMEIVSTGKKAVKKIVLQ